MGREVSLDDVLHLIFFLVSACCPALFVVVLHGHHRVVVKLVALDVVIRVHTFFFSRSEIEAFRLRKKKKKNAREAKIIER